MTPLLGLLAVLAAPDSPLSMSLAEAIDLAVVRDYALRQSRVEEEEAEARSTEVFRTTAFPRVDATLSYTRNFEAANPFAGSDASSLFGSAFTTGWLVENQRRRLGGEPEVPLEDFLAQQPSSSGSGDNPFFVPNQFAAQLNIRQVLYDAAAFAGIEGADLFVNQKAAETRRRGVQVVDEVSRAFYRALLSKRRAEVLAKSVERATESAAEVSRRVEQGVAPKFQLLSAEVERTNLETQHLQASNDAVVAVDVLKFAVGVPVDRPLALRGDLEVTDAEVPARTLDEATQVAFDHRPDVKVAAQGIALLGVQVDRAEAGYLPNVSAFLRVGYVGNVPDDRTTTVPAPSNDDPFATREMDEGFFSDAYWFPSVALGVELTWNLFEGFGNAPRVQQAELSMRRSKIGYERLREAVRLEVERTRRSLLDARRRLTAQSRNIERAETNYEHTRIRVREGVSTPFELREASEQLDLARLNRLQAAHDFLVARVAYRVALGLPAGGRE